MNSIAYPYLLLSIILASCSGSIRTAREEAFNGLYDSIPMNQYLKLQIPDPTTIYGSQDIPPDDPTITLFLENYTDVFIHFNREQDIKILAFDKENGWREIPNRVTYNDKDVILTPMGTLRYISTVFVLPDPYAGAKQVRVVVIGTIMRDDQLTNERVGAYVDVDLE